MFKNNYAVMGIVLLFAIAASPTFGRGFGGFHGGGYGGYRGGGFHAGQTEGFHDREAGAYQATGPRGTEVEGVHGGSYGGYQHEGAGGYRGEAGGAYREGGYGGYHGAAGEYHGGAAGTYREGSYGGYHGSAGEYHGGAAGAYRAGGYGGYYGGGVPTRSGVNQFLGLPTDAGLHAAGHVAVPPGGYGGYAAGRAAAAGYAGIHYVSPGAYQSQALAVRNNFYGYHLFTPAWYGAHPYAWNTAGLTASAWTAASWAGLGSWFNVDTPPVNYDYGNTITYQGDTVYVNGQPSATADQYYQQASDLASAPPPVSPPPETESPWMPLGVFGLAPGNQADSSTVIQLAVNKAGTLQGNFYNEISDTTLPIHGAVDKKTQRVAWTVGKNKNTVFDTGLYNLTKDQAPVLVHMGKAKTQQWLMVRMKQKDTD